jgi:hypothetical protein
VLDQSRGEARHEALGRHSRAQALLCGSELLSVDGRWDDPYRTTAVERLQKTGHGGDRSLRGKPDDRSEKRESRDEIDAHGDLAARAVGQIHDLVTGLQRTRGAVEEGALEGEELALGPREGLFEVRDVDSAEPAANLESIEPWRISRNHGNPRGPHRPIQSHRVRDVPPSVEARSAATNRADDRDRPHRVRYRLVAGSGSAATKAPKRRR